MGLQSKWVSSSISLLKVCVALGSEVFLSGEKVFVEGRVGIRCVVTNSRILLYGLNLSVLLDEAEHQSGVLM